MLQIVDIFAGINERARNPWEFDNFHLEKKRQRCQKLRSTAKTAGRAALVKEYDSLIDSINLLLGFRDDRLVMPEIPY